MKKIILFIATVFVFTLNTFAHSGKPKYHVIIDTDGAIDDMRALSMFLSGNDIRVLAVTCSQGTLLPDSVYLKVKSLISAFHCEGIQLGVSPQTDFNLPVWSTFAQNIQWGDCKFKNTDKTVGSSVLLNEITENYKEKITLIALGSLQTYADWIRENPDVITKIDRIVWYNSHNITKGFNYLASPESYEFIKNSGIQIDIVDNVSNNLSVNSNYIEELSIHSGQADHHSGAC